LAGEPEDLITWCGSLELTAMGSGSSWTFVAMALRFDEESSFTMSRCAWVLYCVAFQGWTPAPQAIRAA
jgi:hypothetical protein